MVIGFSVFYLQLYRAGIRIQRLALPRRLGISNDILLLLLYLASCTSPPSGVSPPFGACLSRFIRFSLCRLRPSWRAPSRDRQAPLPHRRLLPRARPRPMCSRLLLSLASGARESSSGRWGRCRWKSASTGSRHRHRCGTYLSKSLYLALENLARDPKIA